MTLAFSSIRELFVRDIHTKFNTFIPNLDQIQTKSNLPWSPGVGQNSDVVIFNFWIIGQITYKQKLL